MSSKKEKQIATNKKEEEKVAAPEDQPQDLGIFGALFASKEKLHFILVNIMVVMLIFSSILMVTVDKKQ